MAEGKKVGVFTGVGKNSKTMYKVDNKSVTILNTSKQLRKEYAEQRDNAIVPALLVLLVGIILGVSGLGLTLTGLFAYVLLPIIHTALTYQSYTFEAISNSKNKKHYYEGQNKVINTDELDQYTYVEYKLKEDEIHDNRIKGSLNYIGNQSNKSIESSEDNLYNLDNKIFPTGTNFNLDSLKELYMTDDKELLFNYELVDIEESVKRGKIVFKYNGKGKLNTMEEITNRFDYQAMEMYKKNDVLPENKIINLMQTYETICYHLSSKQVHETYQKLLDKKVDSETGYILDLKKNEQKLIEELDQLKIEGKNNLEQNKLIINSIQ